MRKKWKIAAWVAGGLAILMLLLTGGLFIAGNSDSGRLMIENLTRRLTSGQVSPTGLAGSFPEHLTLEHLELRDDRGVWLRADRIAVSWSPLALLAWRIQVETLHAASVDMERLPESNKPSSGPVSIPRIDVASLAVDRVNLGPELAGTPASLVLAGNAHLRSVMDMVIDATAHRIDGDGNYELHLRFDPQRMDAALNLHEPASGPLENLLKLPGLGALAATVNLSGPRTAERFELSIDAGALRGRAQGSIDITRLSADFDFAFDSPATAPRAGIAWQRASVHGRWHGSVKSPSADAHFEADQLTLPGAAAATLNADLTADAHAAVLHAVAGGLRIAGLRAQLLEGSPLKIDASMRLDLPARPLDIAASHPLVSLHGSTEVTPADAGTRSAVLEARLPNLAPWAALARQNVRGSGVLKAQLHGDGASTRVTLDANTALSAGGEWWSGPVGERPTVQLSGTVTDHAVTLESLRFTGRALALNAGGDLSRGQDPPALRARWDVKVSDLSTVSPVFTGTLQASGTLNGTTNSLAGEAQLATTVSVRGSPGGTVAADVKIRGLPSAPSGTLAIRGEFDAAPVEVDVAVQSPGGSWRALVNRAEWKSAHANGDITMSPETAQTHGQLHLGVDRLDDLRDVLGIELGGSLAGDVEFKPDHGRTHAELHLDARDVTAGQLAGTAQLSVEGVTDALGFKLDVQLPKLHGAEATLSANGSLDLDGRSIGLAAASANYRGQDLRLLAPAKIALADGLSVDDLKFGMQTAVLEIQGKISPSLDVRASLLRVQPSLVNMFVPGLLESGTIEGHAQLQGSVNAPSGEVKLSALALRMADDAAFGLPPLDVEVASQLHGNTADVDAHLVAGTASHLNVTGRAPLAADGALNLKIDGILEVAMINPLLEAHGQRASGELSIDATVAGNASDPQIAGTVNLAKGSVRDYARGVSLTDINAAVVGSEGTLQIKSFSASAAPGSVTMTGKVGVLQAKIPVELTIKAHNAQPLVSKLVTANLNADLRVTGTARERLDIAGKVHLNRTLIGIPNGLPPEVAVLDVRRRGKEAPPAAEKPLVVGLDVTVEAPQEILVQGRGLDAEMAGDLRLTGTLDTPSVSGGFGLVRGNFSLSGNKLNFLPESRISFNGAGLKSKIDPTLDFTAQSTVGEVTATLKITGYADAPQFEFTSSPPLGQDEILAYLLFGVPGSQLSPLQLAQTAAALASLSGVGGGGGLNPLVKIQKSLGLDRLTVGAGTTQTATGPENSGASIAAGRYISKRVYIEAKQSTSGSSQLEADVDLTKHLKLQTRLGNGTATVIGTTPENDPGSSVGLLYQFEY